MLADELTNSSPSSPSTHEEHSISELGDEASELTISDDDDDETDSPGDARLRLLKEKDFKSWDLHLLRLSTGPAEAFRDKMRGEEPTKSATNMYGVVDEPFGKFESYHLP